MLGVHKSGVITWFGSSVGTGMRYADVNQIGCNGSDRIEPHLLEILWYISW